MKNISLKTKIGLVLGLAAVVTNPLTGQYIQEAIDWLFQQLFTYGAWVTLVAGVYFIGFMVFIAIKESKVNVTSKSKKSPAFIET